jgi:hypothetical protein
MRPRAEQESNKLSKISHDLASIPQVCLVAGLVNEEALEFRDLVWTTNREESAWQSH